MFVTKTRIQILSLALIISLLLALPTVTLATTVRMQTNLGTIDIDLFDEGAPLTVANFLRYVENGKYSHSFFHRSIDNFIIQGGGYTWDNVTNSPNEVQQYAPVVNEFSADRSNLRGTIAMAKLEGDPDSATNQWFFNLADNSANLDNQNSGFTVFGQVKAICLPVIDSIEALQTGNAGGAFSHLPLVSLPEAGVRAENLVIISSAKVLPTDDADDDSDRVFNYLETAYPSYISPSSPPSGTAAGYYYRYYSQTKAYVGTKDGKLYYLGSQEGAEVLDLGSVGFWLARAVAAGY